MALHFLLLFSIALNGLRAADDGRGYSRSSHPAEDAVVSDFHIEVDREDVVTFEHDLSADPGVVGELDPSHAPRR